MSEQKSASLKPAWQIIDIVGKLLVPIVLGCLTLVIAVAEHGLASRQAALQEQEAELHEREIEANRDLKLLEIFYSDITSSDPTRRRSAAVIVATYAKPTLLIALRALEPELAVKSAITMSNNRTLSNQIRSKAGYVRNELMNQFKILQPSDGDTVDMVVPIKATTPFSETWRHYVVVTPLKTGTDFVQTQAALHDGSLEGEARLGAAGVGMGEKFSIRIVATESTLSPGSRLQVPDDAITSNSIIVTRKN